MTCFTKTIPYIRYTAAAAAAVSRSCFSADAFFHICYSAKAVFCVYCAVTKAVEAVTYICCCVGALDSVKAAEAAEGTKAIEAVSYITCSVKTIKAFNFTEVVEAAARISYYTETIKALNAVDTVEAEAVTYI